MDLTGWVMREGVVARASGRVLVIDGNAWFEMPLPMAAIAIWPPPPPRQGPFAVRAHGVDLDRLDHIKHHDGGILEGWTTLTGIWRQRELLVRDQTSAPAAAGWTNPWTTPPCPPPATGWPTAPIHGPMTAANLPAPPQPHECAELTITQLTQFHPHPTQPVLVVAAEDPQRAEQALRPRFGDALCVVRSRYHRHEIDETLQRLRDEQMAHRWLITSSGQSARSDGQPTVSAQFVWIERDVAAWAATGCSTWTYGSHRSAELPRYSFIPRPVNKTRIADAQTVSTRQSRHPGPGQ